MRRIPVNADTKHVLQYLACYQVILLAICLPLLLRMLGLKLLCIHFEEFRRLLEMLAGDIVKCQRRDVVRLSLSGERIVLQKVFYLRFIGLYLRL
jgi:hypothetical protein